MAGALLIRPERLEDERGFFARTFCVRELQEHGVDPRVVQRSISYNSLRGTLRGMHFQAEPHQENKFVSCVRGSVYDAIIDLRPASLTYRAWFATTSVHPQGMRARLHDPDRRGGRSIRHLRVS